MSDEAKKLVLARRARFVAAAFAGMTIACGKEKAPTPCLDVPPAAEDANVPTPQPCLSAVPQGWEPPADHSPRPCLSIAPPEPHDAGAVKKPKGCSPPYTIDANGTKHFKPECL